MQDSMKIDYLDIDKIKPYKRNAKKHPQEQIDQIVKSIEQFGNNDPIAVWGEKNIIVEGHGRYLALKQMGVTGEIPVIHLDHLTDEERRVYGLVHNKLTMNSGFDYDLLEAEFNMIDPEEFDLSDFGFFQDDEEPEKAPAEVTEDDFDESTVTEAVCKRGQVWQLGNHRLMCGDSTSAEDVAMLMNGEKADIAFMSPPYNAGFGANLTKENGRSKYLEGNDNMTSGEYRHFLQQIHDVCIENVEYVFENIQYLANNKDALITFLGDNIDTLADIIIWDKGRSQPQLAVNVLNSEFEFVFCFSKKGNRSIGTVPFHGTLKNIVHISNQRSTEFANIHNATMPVTVAGYFVENFAKKTVLDLFGGTGTTMIACEQLDRNCFMMEISERYCDVIIKRWEDFTGRKAELLEE